jgi:hypothetical protein
MRKETTKHHDKGIKSLILSLYNLEKTSIKSVSGLGFKNKDRE